MAVSVVVSGVVFGVLRSMSGAHSVVVSVVLFLSTTELEVLKVVDLFLFDVDADVGSGVDVWVVFGIGVIICSGHFFMYHGAAPVGVLIIFSGHFLIYHGFAPVS